MNETISRSKNVAEVFNTFSVNVVSNLGIVINENLLGNTGETNDPNIVNINESYKTHPSIRPIKDYTTQLDKWFSFEPITYEEIHKDMKN